MLQPKRKARNSEMQMRTVYHFLRVSKLNFHGNASMLLFTVMQFQREQKRSATEKRSTEQLMI